MEISVEINLVNYSFSLDKLLLLVLAEEKYRKSTVSWVAYVEHSVKIWKPELMSIALYNSILFIAGVV